MGKNELVQYRVNQNALAKPVEEELLIAYRPFHNTEKWIEYRFNEWNTWKAWAALGFVILFFVLGGPQFVMDILQALTGGASAGGSLIPDKPMDSGTIQPMLDGMKNNFQPPPPMIDPGSGAASFTSAKVVEWFAIALSVGGVGAYGLMQRKPTHLLLNDHGIAWEWRRSLMNFGHMVPWSAITHIGVTWPENRTSPQDSLLTFSTASNPQAMQIKLGGIATTEEREQFLKCLETWAPDVSKDAQVYDVLTPPPDHSYTELWLQALSAPPKRERLTPLIAGAVLGEGNYTIVSQLGVGGQGTAYLSTMPDGMEVVLKEFILPVYVDINIRRQALERMQNEVQMLKKLDNDRIVKLRDFFIEDHRGYLVLELIDGDSLRTMVNKNGKLDEKTVIGLMHQMCDMLEYLHSLSPPVVHRDFTPDNLILGSDGILKLVDFNVAQQKDVTATGTVVGKHAYIPPEQFRGKPNHQSDIYAMGASVYFLLIGEDPQPITSSRPKEADENVSHGLDHIVARATALDTGYRYPSAQDLRAELEYLAKNGHVRPQLESKNSADSAEAGTNEATADVAVASTAETNGESAVASTAETTGDSAVANSLDSVGESEVSNTSA
ncbi:serine/threonine protein kinase [Candidatus Obscuribacterales bacterium]|nr:serine/threonine protein kinase [Candidatus Obscuribacterales bacterium]